MDKTRRAPELKEPAVRMLHEHEKEYDSRGAAERPIRGEDGMLGGDAA